MTIDEAAARAAEQLAACDQRLAPIITAIGPCPLKPHRNYYQELVESIIGQQLSVKAAATIRDRFVQLFGHFPSPEEILACDFEELKSVGLSRPKTNYIRDLAGHVIDGTVRFDHLDDLSNQQIIDELTTVKGIGEWTVHMFMIFCMGRTDVLAHGDLGIRMGLRQLYGLDELPARDEVEDIARRGGWAPYQSIACWYVWQSLDNAPK